MVLVVMVSSSRAMRPFMIESRLHSKSRPSAEKVGTC